MEFSTFWTSDSLQEESSIFLRVRTGPMYARKSNVFFDFYRVDSAHIRKQANSLTKSTCPACMLLRMHGMLFTLFFYEKCLQNT